MTRGHWCRICGRRRPNEAFSGRGHRNCICRDCQELPKSERDRGDVARELLGYAKQYRISAQNVQRLTELARHGDPDIRTHAAALIDIAGVYPGKRRRWVRLAASHPALFRRYREAIGVWIEAGIHDVFGDGVLEVLREGEGLAGSDVPASTGDESGIPF